MEGEVHDSISANFGILIALFILFCRNMSFKATLIDFCSSTSIHGLGFIVNEKSSLAQRLGWLFIFLCSLSYATINLKQATESKLKKKMSLSKFQSITYGTLCQLWKFLNYRLYFSENTLTSKTAIKRSFMFLAAPIRVILQLIVTRDF